MIKKSNFFLTALLISGIVIGEITQTTEPNSTKKIAQKIGTFCVTHKKKLIGGLLTPFILTSVLGFGLMAAIDNVQTMPTLKNDDTEPINSENTKLHKTEGGISYLAHIPAGVDENTPTVIYLPGWPQDSMSISQFPLFLSDLLPWDKNTTYKKMNVFMPIFTELHEHDENSHQVHMFATSFGQERDIRCVLQMIKEQILSKNHIPQIIFIGRSRGGLALGSVLEVLSTEDHPLLIELGMNKQREDLLNNIIHICFSVPLVDVKEVIQNKFGRIIGAFGRHITLPIATQGLYSPSKNKNLVTMIANWNLNRNIPVTVIHAGVDEVVGNQSDQQLKDILGTKFERVTCAVTPDGHNGGTQDSFISRIVRNPHERLTFDNLNPNAPLLRMINNGKNMV